jgi:glutaminyl-tRNA synthetase
MGYEPWKVTYASDNFGHLYEFALTLIKTGHAFVCSETKEEMKASRDAGKPSKDRERPIAESLKLFQ